MLGNISGYGLHVTCSMDHVSCSPLSFFFFSQQMKSRKCKGSSVTIMDYTTLKLVGTKYNWCNLQFFLSLPSGKKNRFCCVINYGCFPTSILSLNIDKNYVLVLLFHCPTHAKRIQQWTSTSNLTWSITWILATSPFLEFSGPGDLPSNYSCLHHTLLSTASWTLVPMCIHKVSKLE